MKRIIRITFLLLVFVLFSGFTKYNLNMDIKDDKSVEIKLIYAYDVREKKTDDDTKKDEADDPNDFGIISENTLTKLKENGFTIEKFTDKTKLNWIGITVSKKYDVSNITKNNAKELELIINSLNDELIIDDSQLFQSVNDHYKASIIIDLSTLIKSVSDELVYKDTDLDLTFNLTLPQRSITNNASKVSDDGKTLTWNLIGTKKNKIVFEFGYENNEVVPSKTDSRFMTYLFDGLIVVVIVVGIIILLNKRKKNKKEVVTDDYPQINIDPEPVGPIVTNPTPLDNTEEKKEEPNEPVVQPAIELNNVEESQEVTPVIPDTVEPTNNDEVINNPV